VAGPGRKSGLEGRLEVELVEARLGRPAAGRGVGSPDENPTVVGAISEQGPLAALDGALVDTKFFDAGRSRDELIAMFLQIVLWKARVGSKGSLLVGVGLQLLLSGLIRGDWFGPKMEASSGCESEASRDEQKNGSTAGRSRSAPSGGIKAEIHTREFLVGGSEVNAKANSGICARQVQGDSIDSRKGATYTRVRAGVIQW
jgi:hypothetical protein